MVHPADQISRYATLHDAVFQQVPDFIVHKGSDDCGLQAKALTKTARYVVLAAASQTSNERDVRKRPSPGSKRSMVSPSEI
jgi:hypothetical protein